VANPVLSTALTARSSELTALITPLSNYAQPFDTKGLAFAPGY